MSNGMVSQMELLKNMECPTAQTRRGQSVRKVTTQEGNGFGIATNIIPQVLALARTWSSRVHRHRHPGGHLVSTYLLHNMHFMTLISNDQIKFFLIPLAVDNQEMWTAHPQEISGCHPISMPST